MTISKKVLFSFLAIILLFATLFVLSMLSEKSIAYEGTQIDERLNASQVEVKGFQEIASFSDSMDTMLLIVLRLGYAGDLEETESLMTTFNQYFTQSEEKAKELGIYETLIEDFNNIRGQVDSIYLNKIDEVNYAEQLINLKTTQSDQMLQVRMNNDEKAEILKVSSTKINEFKKAYEGLESIYQDRDDFSEEDFQNIADKLKTTGYLVNFKPLEIEQLWTEEYLGMGIDQQNFLALILNTREMIMEPKNAAENIKKAEELQGKVVRFVDLQTKYGFGVIGGVAATLIKESLDIYLEQLKTLKSLQDKEAELFKSKQSIDDEVEYISFSGQFANEMALEIINLEFDETITSVQKKLEEISGEKVIALNESISAVREASQNSISIISESNMRILVIVLASIVLSLVIAFFIRRTIKKSMKSLKAKTDRVQGLDLSVEFEENIKNDELGNAEQAIREIVSSMKGTLINVKGSMASVQGTTSELESISNESRDISNDLKQISDRTDQNVQDTSAAIEEVSSGIEEVAASAKNVSDISRELYEQTSQTSESAKTGEQELTKVTEIVREAEVQASETSKHVSSLQEQAKHVGEIVGTISSISEQTNLLALNAAIEAARAGEAGKGFAVVADEIRKLAEESKKATEDIANRLKEIGNGVQSVNNASDKTLDIVNNMNDTAQSAMAQFNQISSNLMIVLDSVENLSNTAEEQSAAADEIAGAMDQSAQSMVHAASQVELLVNQVEKQMHSVELLNGSTEQLARLADELNDEIDKFTV